MLDKIESFSFREQTFILQDFEGAPVSPLGFFMEARNEKWQIMGDVAWKGDKSSYMTWLSHGSTEITENAREVIGKCEEVDLGDKGKFVLEHYKKSIPLEVYIKAMEVSIEADRLSEPEKAAKNAESVDMLSAFLDPIDQTFEQDPEMLKVMKKMIPDARPTGKPIWEIRSLRSENPQKFNDR